MCSFIVAAAAAASPLATSGPVLYVDDTFQPRFSIAWQTDDGELKLEGQRGYTAPEDRVPLGHNLEAFIAVGGTRLTKGAGRESGSILRVGFYKQDTKKLLFEGIEEGSSVVVTLSGIRFSREGAPVVETAIQHLKYTEADITECGLSREAMDQYNTASATDTLGGKITAENARMGSLDGAPDDRAGENGGAALEGDVDVWLEEDGSVSMRAEIPYAMFRHVRDPWMRSDPGGFFEPYHFHIELEAIPVEVWEEEFEDRPLPRRAEEGPGEREGGGA